MAFNISEFRSNLNRHAGAIRSSHFDVSVFIPPSVPSEIASRDLLLFAEAATLPGVSLQTSEVRQFGYGLVEKRPYRTAFVDTDITFIEDSEAKTLSVFQNWINTITKFADRTNIERDGVMYPDEYVTNILITQYNTTDVPVLTCELSRAFPVQVNPIALDWKSQNEFSKFQVTFAYQSWDTNKVE